MFVDVLFVVTYIVYLMNTTISKGNFGLVNYIFYFRCIYKQVHFLSSMQKPKISFNTIKNNKCLDKFLESKKKEEQFFKFVSSFVFMEEKDFDKKMGLEPFIIALIGLLIAGLIFVWIGMKIMNALRQRALLHLRDLN